jgi:hypothetical protein
MRYAGAVRGPVVALALLCVLAPGWAAADDGPALLVDLSECEQLPAREVRRVLQAEVGAHFTEVDEFGATTVEITCDGDRVRLLIRDPVTRKSVRRYLDLRGTAEGSRARLVAIASAELLFATWAELEVNPNPVVEPAEPPPPPEAMSAARRVVRERMPSPRPEPAPEPTPEPPAEPERRSNRPIKTPPRFVAFGSARGFVLYPGLLWGGGVRLGEERFEVVSWSLDTMFEWGSLRNQRGNFAVTNATLGGIVSFYQNYRYATVRAGAGLRIGLVRTESRLADVTSSNSAVAPWGWPLGAVSLTVRLGRGVLLDLGGEAGYVVLPTTAGTSQLGDSSFQGAWYGLQLGMGLEL